MQTYGNVREIVWKVRKQDLQMAHFLSHFDENIISFHNCSPNTIANCKEIVAMLGIQNLRYFEFENISYPRCVEAIAAYVNDNGFDRLFFYQDDVFSAGVFPKSEISALYRASINLPYMVNYEIDVTATSNRRDSYLDQEGLRFFNSLTQDVNFNFTNRNFEMDDSPVLLTREEMNFFWDAGYFSYPDIWAAELYLFGKVKQKPMPRYLCEKRYFKRYWLCGQKNYNEIYRKYDLELLKEVGLSYQLCAQ
jgi:hypothetical protein